MRAINIILPEWLSGSYGFAEKHQDAKTDQETSLPRHYIGNKKIHVFLLSANKNNKQIKLHGTIGKYVKQISMRKCQHKTSSEENVKKKSDNTT